MVRHNNIVPNQHFHKKWEKRIKTWFQQPLQKKIRREKRKERAAAAFPRPAQGALRPVVHCPTQKYNMKVRYGRGFTLEELKECKLTAKYARTIGIAVDHRRRNTSVESLNTNVDRLKEYMSRLVIFPRKAGVVKKGDATKEELDVGQLAGDIIAKPTGGDAITFTTDVDALRDAPLAYSTLRNARNAKKMFGPRQRAAQLKKEAEDAK